MSRLEQRLNWAREQVGVPEGAPLADVRARFFAAVERENFVPDEGLDRAFRTLRWEAEGVIDAEDPPEFLQAEETALYEAVEGFAAKMFSLPVDQRRQRWADLYRRCEYAPRLRVRLDRLTLGLDAEFNGQDASKGAMHATTLGRYAAELFPLRPAARAARRHAILAALYKDNIKAWRKAAQTLKSKNPKVAALAPDLIDQLATAGVPQTGPSQVTVRRNASSHRGTGWALGVALCILISFIVRAGMIASKHSSSPAPHYNLDIQRALEQARRAQQQAQPAPSPFPSAAPQSSGPGSSAETIHERFGPRPTLQRHPFEPHFPPPGEIPGQNPYDVLPGYPPDPRVGPRGPSFGAPPPSSFPSGNYRP
jgi:hypothetical protein